ncbi:SusC/RagA family TonB-linked outer membrane protein [Marinilabilia salmonicolor]|uniref:SusC/RagA family TonB-linked outer membrane protein n=1 Tax=Marinilabilia salmonicolor TaxID=989 RepID=UPI00029A84B8|nr:TonB-dependent receptor [Marinilabilia salmonicolor]
MRKTLLFICFLMVSAFVFGQDEISVSGKVTDSDGLGIPGASIVIEGTTTGTITDMDGNYNLSVPPDATLTFSFVGLQSQIVPVEGRSVINVQMTESTVDLEEVVVVGYGEMKVKDLTSSITTIKSDDLAKTPTGQAMQAMQGKVAGMQVVSSGAPGDAPTIRVRGIGSYPGQGNESPLYVVDGMFFDNIDFLNSSDITSISVLKDASAAAIYGVRAANGVVLIETKSGSYNKEAEITYDGYYGVQVAQDILKMANAEQFTTMAMESGSATDAQYIQNAMQRYGRSRINPNVPDVNTDWYDEILRPGAIQNHSVAVSGGGENTTYSLGANYFAQEGILDMKNDYERFNLRSKIDYRATDRLTVGANVIFSNSTKYMQDGAAWFEAYYAVPVMPVYDEQNEVAWPDKFASAQTLGYRGGKNPFTAMTYSDNRDKQRKTMASFYAELDIIPDVLSLKTTYNHDFTSSERREVRLPYYLTEGAQRKNSSVAKTAANWSNQSWDNVLTFQQDFGPHDLTVMAGTSYRDEAYQDLWATGLDFPVNQEQAWYLNQSKTTPENSVNDNGLRQYGMSYFGRISYNYNNRYLLYGTMRADGSSKYQETWGYFPTIGAGWVVSEESFMDDVSFIDYLKIRGSWGELGNDKIQASDGARTTTVINTAIDDNLVAGIIASSTYGELEWELTEETNIGLTSRFLDSNLSLEADYYIRDTKNAAIYVNIPSVGQRVLRNVGVIRNSGFELALNYSNSISDDLSYSVGANISTLENEVRDLYGQPYIDGGSAEFRQRSIVGEPLLAFFGHEVTGVFQNEEQIANSGLTEQFINDSGIEPGDFIYKDQNGDNVIDDKDRVVLGSYFPSFMYGANLGVNYRNFDFSLSLTGQTGNKILNRKRGEIIWTNDGNLDADLAINRWHGEGTSNKYPSSAGLRKGYNQKMSDYFVEDGSFFRIQNVQLGYTLDTENWLGGQLPGARIYVTAERPVTVFDYNGFNPEVSDGIDRQTYPIPAVYTVGLNLKF